MTFKGQSKEERREMSGRGGIIDDFCSCIFACVFARMRVFVCARVRTCVCLCVRANAHACVQVFDEKTGGIKEVTMVGESREDAFSWKGHVLQKMLYKDTKRLTNGCVMQPVQVKGGDSGKVHFHVYHHSV